MLKFFSNYTISAFFTNYDRQIFRRVTRKPRRSVYCGIFGRSRGARRRSYRVACAPAPPPPPHPPLPPALQIQTVSIAAPPVAVNIVFSFRRGERVLLLPAHERWAPQSILIKMGRQYFFVCFINTVH